MKRVLASLLVIAMILGLTACAGEPSASQQQNASVPGSSSQPSGSTSEPASAAEKKGLLYLCLNLGDLSFNDSGWEGCQEAAAKYGYEPAVIELGKDTSTYESAFLDACDSGKYSLLVTQSNYGLSDLCMKYGPDYPDMKFVAFDMSASAEVTADNVFGIAYKQNEGSFLVGALSAKLSKSGKLGTFIFNDVPVGNDFLSGYIDGVRYANPDAEISVAYGGGTADASKVQEVTSAMYDSGVDVIYGVTGAGNLGLFKETNSRGGFAKGLYAIGVDSDQYTLYKNSENAQLADCIVTSMLKNVGASIVYACDLMEQGKLEWGKVDVFGIAEGSVGIADNDYYRSEVPQEILDYIDKLQADVLSGAVKVKSYFDFANYDEFTAWKDGK